MSMRKGLVVVGLAAMCAWPIASMARVWVGAEAGVAGGPLAGTSPFGVYAGISSASFPLAGEINYQALSTNPGDIGLFTVTALYRRPIPRAPGMHYLLRAGVAVIYGDHTFVKSTTRPIIGAGVSYDLTRHVSLRGEYDLILGDRTVVGPPENGNEVLASVTYHFAR